MKNVIPTPRQAAEYEGCFEAKNLSVFVDSAADKRIVKAAQTLCRELEALTHSYVPISSSGQNKHAVVVTHGEGGESYKLTVEKDRITVCGSGAAGAFYGIQTLRQLICANGLFVPCCRIDDAPDFVYRGFYHDISRGRVNRLETLKKIADMLSYFKMNSLQLYVEDAFTFKELEGISTAENALTPEEILELDDYCHDRFIDLVPSLSTFGHLFTLLQSDRYCDICELGQHEITRNYWLERQWHHTVDVYNPKTIQVIGSMLEQYIPLFRSKYFNICCDETLDLCSGKNQGKDKGEAYFYHLDKLIEIVKSHGKTPMMWGDECMARPEAAKKRVPGDTVILNWCYRKQVNEWIPKFYYDLGFIQIVCPGTSCWDNFVEDIDTSVGNISDFSAFAKKYGALGVLNTNWGDFGHICAFNCNLYGALVGAQKSWNSDSPTDEAFERSATLLMYGIKDYNIANVLRKLSKAASACSWSRFVIWHSANTLEGKETRLTLSDEEDYDPNDGINALELCRQAILELTSLDSDDRRITDLLLAARGLALMNREYLYVNKAPGFCDGAALQKDFDSWLAEYSASWLVGCKPSGLSRVQEFIRNITNVI